MALRHYFAVLERKMWILPYSFTWLVLFYFLTTKNLASSSFKQGFCLFSF